MQNLVINQNGIYTFRKSINGTSLRVSLKTDDKSEAIRVATSVNSVLALAKSNDARTVQAIIYSALNKYQPVFAKERLVKVQELLEITLKQEGGC